MTSFERVRRTLAFEQPDRVPLATGPDSDIVGIGYKPAGYFRPQRENMNEWGIVWKSLNREQGDQGQVAEHPLADWTVLLSMMCGEGSRFRRAWTSSQ